MNDKITLEYIWLDGNTPTPSLRSKIKFCNKVKEFSLEDVPYWNFDGSSTNQANTSSSDCVLKPVSMYRTFFDDDNYLVLCEVLNSDMTPHASNTRNAIIDQEDFWFGFEQEYFLIDCNTNRPLGWSSNPNEYPAPQGDYYCAVGSNAVGRGIVMQHAKLCLGYGIDVTGVNAEVAKGQWEYQVLGKGAIKAADDLWISRFILERICAEYNLRPEFHPKPLGNTDWNGSGMHTNFSNQEMRETGGKELFDSIIESFKISHASHISVYGSDNEQRLTGKHETCSINEFRAGNSDRGASIRIPLVTSENWKGYLEDRRPASNADPYKVVNAIVNSVNFSKR